MIVYVHKDDWKWFEEAHSEGRTRSIMITTYPTSQANLRLEVRE